ncbi:VanZ family protein [Bacillus gobiensis]|uniref:VanZ family protein n=1 Tax=Bacillus gobiensis TaxID=1441095 RepID=UPI003D21DF3D
MKGKYMKKFPRLLVLILLGIYLCVLTKVILIKFLPLADFFKVIFSFHTRGTVNLIPFRTISNYLFADINLNIIIENLVGNILAFCPLGILLPFLSNRFHKWGTILLSGLAVSLFYEIIQFTTALGSFDVDDLILNVTGAALGFLPVKAVLSIRQRQSK